MLVIPGCPVCHASLEVYMSFIFVIQNDKTINCNASYMVNGL